MTRDVDDLIKRAQVKSGMLRMGERIEFGSDADIIDELVAALKDELAEANRVIEPFANADDDGDEPDWIPLTGYWADCMEAGDEDAVRFGHLRAAKRWLENRRK